MLTAGEMFLGRAGDLFGFEPKLSPEALFFVDSAYLLILASNKHFGDGCCDGGRKTHCTLVGCHFWLDSMEVNVVRCFAAPYEHSRSFAARGRVKDHGSGFPESRRPVEHQALPSRLARLIKKPPILSKLRKCRSS